MKRRRLTSFTDRSLTLCIGLVFIVTASANRPLAAQTSSSSTNLKQSIMQLDDLYTCDRISSPEISRDGTMIVYQVANVDAKTNKSKSRLMLVSVENGQRRTLTNSEFNDNSPKFSPDGKTVLFVSNRSGTSQLWTIAIDGGEASQLTTIETGASTPVWSHDGQRIAFVSEVFPKFMSGSDEELAKQNSDLLKAQSEAPTKVRVFDRLFYRHWDSYVEGKRQHLFVINVEQVDGRLIAKGLPHDATLGDRDANPTSSTFSSGRDFCFSPDNKHLIFTATPSDPVQRSLESWSTNYDLCRVSVENTSSDWDCITSSNLAADSGPQISPDGGTLAWRVQKIPGAEADRWLIATQAVSPDGKLTGNPTTHEIADDVSVGEFIWQDNTSVLFTAEWQGRARIYKQSVLGNSDKGRVYADEMGGVHDLSCSQHGQLAFSESRFNAPADVFVQKSLTDKSVINLSKANTALIETLSLTVPEWSMDVAVEGDVKMQMWIIKPPNMEPNKKYPTVYMVHGGPQGAWNDAWSFRWNPALWAAQGYVVVLPNPRGSTGFGQKFTDEISGDWGGKCYRDLMAGMDLVERLPYVDRNRIAAAGASFGGYMMNWFSVNTDRFCTLVTHCSVFNFESMWGSTDELWFDEYEHGGMPWEKPGSYREFSPHTKAGDLAKFKTPMLVIHNDLDFRCPIGQGIELFTCLQRLNVPSRFVNFPDEGHWVNKAANGHRWHTEVFEWLDKYCKSKK